MSFLSKLLGTLQDTFQIGKSGPKLKNSSGTVEVRNNADNDYSALRASHLGTSPNYYDVANFLNLIGRLAEIEFGFNGASAPSPGANTSTFGICHTAGGAYSAGDIVFDNGSSLIKIPHAVVKHITVKNSISGTKSFIAGGFYSNSSGTFSLRGDGTGVSTGMVRTIALDVAHTDTNVDSTTSIPENAIVLSVKVKVTSAFNGTAPTLQVTVNGSSALTISATTDSDLKNVEEYVNLDSNKVSATNAGGVRASLTPDGSSSGELSVYVEYVLPLS